MVCVVIVNWNVRELLRACLRALDAYPATRCAQRIIVVDNASTDGSAEMVCSAFPAVHLVANQTNRGFTGGNNDGLRAAADLFRAQPEADHFVLLLNPDAEVTAGALDVLLDFALAHPRIGVVGPRLRYPDGRVQSSRRRFPTLATALFESTPLQPIAPPGLLRRFYAQDLPDNIPVEVDWVVGAAMLVRWAAIQRVGGLDEGFFMYSEEVDWCRRIKADGWQVWHHPTAEVIHHEAQSSSQVAAQRMIYFNTSKVRYFAKHHGRRQAELVRLALLGLWGWEWFVESAKWLIGHKRPLRAERRRAYAEALRSGFLPAC
ncbi:MAG: glycosyltransferase family 2 protein [Anaerolineae bacterium]|nr:glycosyltransferase family 2 protein [Anaerolineae bacterium]